MSRSRSQEKGVLAERVENGDVMTLIPKNGRSQVGFKTV
jgi:hypothetical protein